MSENKDALIKHREEAIKSWQDLVDSGAESIPNPGDYVFGFRQCRKASEEEITLLKKEIESSNRLAQIQSSKLHWAIGLFTDEQHEWFKGMLKTQGLSLDPPIDHVDRLNKEIGSLKRIIQNSSKVNESLKDRLKNECEMITSAANKEIESLKKEIEELKSHKQYKVDMITLIRLKEDENQKLRELVERQFKGHGNSEEIEQWLKEASEVLK